MALTSQAETIFERARSSHLAGDFAAAARGYADILRNDPAHADAWHLAGLLAHQTGRSDNAVKQIRIAIQINGQEPEYYSNLAAILNKLNRISIWIANDGDVVN